MSQQSRIALAIDASQTEALQGTVPRAARTATDLGQAEDGMAIAGLTLRFNMNAGQQAALSQLLRDQQNPASPRYHQWLTPEQFGAQFGLPPADLQKVSAWLTGQGFSVTQVARGGLFVRFSGTAGQVNRAFHTPIHRMTLDGRSHFSNLTAPQLPVSLAAVAGGISGLHDFRLKPRHRLSRPGGETTATNRLVPAYNWMLDGSVFHALAPGDFYTIYDEGPQLAAGIDGSGVSIAVVGQSDIVLDDIAAFRTAGGLPANVPTQVLYGQDPGFSTQAFDEAESELDLQWSGAIAPSANIIFARGLDVFNDALTGVIDNNLAPIISISYGDCEAEGHTSQNQADSFELLFQMANAQGQTLVAGSGDWGATSCDYYVPIATQGLATFFPASSPFVTAVGGTEFEEGSGSYWSSSNGANGESALSYIPEVAWNDGGLGGITGGGVSSYFMKPDWQVGAGVPADFARDVPDVSLYADDYLTCSVTSCTDGFTDASGDPAGKGGGTSFSAPAFVGILALVEQKTGGRIGNANPTIYALANSSYYGSVFHDITVGSNASPCTAGTPDCPYGGSIGYLAGTGYDLATGWGSVDVTNLVNSWGLVTPLASKTGEALSAITLAGAPNTVVQGAPIAFTVTVASISPTNTSVPTGMVQLLLDNVAAGAPMQLVGGTVACSLDTTNTAGVDHTVQIAYLGDAVFAGARASFPITVTSTSASVVSTMALSGTPKSVLSASGMAINLTATVASGSGATSAIPTGSVGFQVDNIAVGVPVLLRAGVATYSLDTGYLEPGDHTVQATYFGDSNFAPSTGTFAVTVTSTAPPPPSPDFTLTPAELTVTAKSGSSVTLPVFVLGLNGFAGNVQFSVSTPNASFSSNPVAIVNTSSYSTQLTLFAYNVASPSTQNTRTLLLAGSGIALAGLLMLGLPGWRRAPLLLAAIISTGLLAATGCGGNAGTGSPSQGGGTNPNATPPGTYTVTITGQGTSGATNITHTATVTFVVQ